MLAMANRDSPVLRNVSTYAVHQFDLTQQQA
jgi:hypothetical protein